MALRLCDVRSTDGRGVTHSVQVHASSVLDEGLGVKTIRETGVLDDGGAFDIQVEIHTVTRHRMPYSRVQAWLESSSASPKEKATKENLKSARRT